jgi:hypothetical protein
MASGADVTVPFKCIACDQPVDIEGVTLSSCPVNRPPEGECDECGACYCDGSC